MSPDPSISSVKSSVPASMANGEKGKCEVHCSTKANKWFEFLILFTGSQTIISTKRLAPDRILGDHSSSKNVELKGDWILKNGVTWDCMHCANNSIFHCNCGGWSSQTHKNKLTCAHCDKITYPHEKHSTHHIAATHKKIGHTQLGESVSGIIGHLVNDKQLSANLCFEQTGGDRSQAPLN